MTPKSEDVVVYYKSYMFVVCHRLAGMVLGYTLQSIRHDHEGGEAGMHDSLDQAIAELEARIAMDRYFSAWMTQE